MIPSSSSTCCFIKVLRSLHTVRIHLSRAPPWWEAARGLKTHFTCRCKRNLCIFSRFQQRIKFRSTFFWSYNLGMTASGNKSSHSLQERIRVEAMRNFNVHRSYCLTGKQDAISVNQTSSILHHKRSKVIDTDECKRRLAQSNPTSGRSAIFCSPTGPCLLRQSTAGKVGLSQA